MSGQITRKAATGEPGNKGEFGTTRRGESQISVGLPADVHPEAVVDPRAQLGQGATVGAFSVVSSRSRVGDRTEIRSEEHTSELQSRE